MELRDHTGAVHPLKADQECRNTMFNGRPQSAALLVPSLLAKGVRRFRVEALYEDGATLRAKVWNMPASSPADRPEEVFTRMGVVEKYGVMEGQLRNAVGAPRPEEGLTEAFPGLNCGKRRARRSPGRRLPSRRALLQPAGPG